MKFLSFKKEFVSQVICKEVNLRIIFQKDFDFWKLPGGLVDQGEYISQAAEREVFECYF